MSFYKQYTSPLGYVSNGNPIDTYGVDHSGFTTRDELQYQTARINRENELMKQYNNHGITENYPQYTTNFWGSSADNNYGFGTSNIGSNIENRQQTASQPQNSISDAYSIYKNKGLYGLGMKYAEPSVQQAIQAKDRIAPLPISDVNKHQYISCVGSTGGPLATLETLGGGIYKEIQDTKDKLMDPQKRKAYGGALGVLGDGAKDLKNDFIGSAFGYTVGKYNLPDLCDVLLYNPINFEK
ncbi:MAG: hypothetical protein IJ545_02120 [Alphaproteobacteria bacterium]|nr:hypothetical protein [Alphaproteobacteria bacterium]